MSIKKLTETLQHNWRKLYKSVWLFPVLGLFVLLLLTSLQISGSSVGTYYKFLYGSGAKDSNLLLGTPRPIRSDEWEWQKSMSEAQITAGFPKINKNIGIGQDMEIVVDSPYLDWSTIFKPQNLSYLILPIAFAMAFKWWFLAYALIVSCYFFVLLLLPKKRLWAAFISLCLFFSPFIQWWYQTITLAPIFYCFLIIISFVKLWDSKERRSQVLWAIALSYFLVNFAIVLYPPFQIPCALVTGTFLLGYILEKGYLKYRDVLLRQGFITLLSLLVAGLVILGFVATNKTAIQATQNSVYPGKRVSLSGHFDANFFFSNFLDSQLQLTRKAKNYYLNQSEASNFILLAPLLSVPSLYAIGLTYKRKKKIDWPLLLTTVLFGLILIRLFVPHTDLLFNLFFLDSVPNARLLIGAGLISFIQFILFIRHLFTHKLQYPKVAILVWTLVIVGLNLSVAFTTRKLYPTYVHNVFLISVLATIPVIIVCLLMLRKFAYAIVLLLIFSIGSSGLVNPLYHGSGPLINSILTRQIAAVGENFKNARWAVVDNLTIENVPQLSGVDSITGTYAYPQNNLWVQAPEIANQKSIYNRFAHTMVRFNNGPTHLELKQPDIFEIVSPACSNLFPELHVKFFVTQKDYTKQYPCLQIDKIVQFPNTKFYLLELR